MENQSKSKYLWLGLLLLVVFAAGRFSVATKITEEKTVTTETDKKTVTDEKTKTDTDRDKKVETITIEKVLPDGTREKTTHTVQETKTTRTTDKTTNTNQDEHSTEVTKETKVTERNSGTLTISALAGFKITDLATPPVYGASVTKTILGPITVGIWGLSSGVLGASAGLTF